MLAALKNRIVARRLILQRFFSNQKERFFYSDGKGRGCAKLVVGSETLITLPP
jgi:hypothetical protein